MGQAMAVFALMTAVAIIAGSGARITARKVENPNRFRHTPGELRWLASRHARRPRRPQPRTSWLGIGGAVLVLSASTYVVVISRRTHR